MTLGRLSRLPPAPIGQVRPSKASASEFSRIQLLKLALLVAEPIIPT